MESVPSFDVEGRERGLQPYVRAVRLRIRLVCALTLAAIAVAVVLVLVRQPSYEASAKLLVKPLPPQSTALLDLDLVRDTGDPTRTMQTAVALVDTQPAARGAAARLGDGWTADSLLGATDVKVQGESNVLEVLARADGAAKAAGAANAFADAALATRREALAAKVRPAIARTTAQLRQPGLPPAAAESLSQRLADLEEVRDGDPTIVMAERAFPPSGPAGVPGWIVVGLSGIAGFVVAVGAALLRELVATRTRDEQDVLASFPAPLLGGVPMLSRGEREQFALNPTELPPRVREAYRLVMVQLERIPTEGRVIMLASASAGDGKTTAALQLALVLAEQGKDVLLVDLDARTSELTRRLGLTSRAPTVAQLDQADPLAHVVSRSVPGGTLKVLPAPRDIGVASTDAQLARVPAIFAQANLVATYVIIDTPALGEVSDALRVALHADHIVMIARPGNTNKRQLEEAYSLLRRTGSTVRGVLMNGVRHSQSSPYYDPAPYRAPELSTRIGAAGAYADEGEEGVSELAQASSLSARAQEPRESLSARIRRGNRTSTRGGS